MNLVQTPSFQLAVYTNGNPDVEKLFLFLPGFLDAGNYDHLKGHREYSAERGYFCVSFDPPGTFSSPGGIELYTVTNYLKAIHEVIEYYGNKETIVFGHSLGGTMAFLSSKKNVFIQKCIAIMSPYSFQKLFSNPKYVNRKDKHIRKGTRDIPDSDSIREYAISYSFVEDALYYDVETCLKELTKPKLFIAGLQYDIERVKEGKSDIHLHQNQRNIVK